MDNSISALMAKSLDLIGEGLDEDKAGHQKATSGLSSECTEPSASRILLDEKRKLRESQLVQDFVPFKTSLPAQTNPLFEEITGLTIDKPTYWKSQGTKKGDKGSDGGKASIPSRKSKNQEKGEQYKDKHLEKMAGKVHRKCRLATQKKMY